jgi:hypothetical protein
MSTMQLRLAFVVAMSLMPLLSVEWFHVWVPER